MTIRVLVVDDSAFARKVIRESLAASPGIEVVGTARDGIDALEKLSLLSPDVVTLDLVMPNLDGLGFLAALPPSPPRVVVVSSASDESELVMAALQLGAIAFVHKPTAQATDRMYEIRDPLADAVIAAARARPTSLAPPARAVVVPRATRRRVIVVGASTGGPQALTHVFTGLPADFAVPIATVLHLPVGYTEAFAKRLDEASALDVAEASDGRTLAPRTVTVARAGLHLLVTRDADGRPRARLDVHPLQLPHRPSVDVLFESAAQAFGADVLGVVLTGMGSDGLVGSRAIRAAGGAVLTQDEASAVVYGMPRVVAEAGLSNRSVPLDGMVEAILEHA